MVTLVIAEQRDGVLNRASLEAIVAAQLMGGDVKVVVPGAPGAAVSADLTAADVTEVIAVDLRVFTVAIAVDVV